MEDAMGSEKIMFFFVKKVSGIFNSDFVGFLHLMHQKWGATLTLMCLWVP